MVGENFWPPPVLYPYGLKEFDRFAHLLITVQNITQTGVIKILCNYLAYGDRLIVQESENGLMLCSASGGNLKAEIIFSFYQA